MKKLLLLLLFIPTCMFGQGEDSIPSTGDTYEKIKQLPIAYQRIFIDVMNNAEISDGKMTYTLPNGESLTSDLSDASSSDNFWNRIYEANKVTEICNIPFGSTYERAKEILGEKYGEYDYLYSKKDDIIYKRKKYAGVDFDSMHFLFQSDGIRSYFNAAIFCIDCKSKAEAIRMKKILHEKLSKRYSGFMELDEGDAYLSLGGLPPVPSEQDMGFGVHIDIRDYGHDGKVLGSPYGVRLIYGPYDYVKEEF